MAVEQQVTGIGVSGYMSGGNAVGAFCLPGSGTLKPAPLSGTIDLSFKVEDGSIYIRLDDGWLTNGNVVYANYNPAWFGVGYSYWSWTVHLDHEYSESEARSASGAPITLLWDSTGFHQQYDVPQGNWVWLANAKDYVNANGYNGSVWIGGCCFYAANSYIVITPIEVSFSLSQEVIQEVKKSFEYVPWAMYTGSKWKSCNLNQTLKIKKSDSWDVVLNVPDDNAASRGRIIKNGSWVASPISGEE